MKNKEQLVVVHKDEFVVSTWLISKKMGIKHQSVKKLMARYQIEPFDVGFMPENEALVVIQKDNNSKPKKAKEGRKVEEYFLTERNARRLILRMRTTKNAVANFKDNLIDEFQKQKEALLWLRMTLRNNQQNAEWLAKRESGKIERHTETDVIKRFVVYATAQGSKNADKYYMILTKMENSTLFHLEFVKFEYDNFRDVVNGMGLDALRTADHIVARALEKGMSQGMYYKDIYKLAKSNVENFADIFGKMYVDDCKKIDPPKDEIGELRIT